MADGSSTARTRSGPARRAAPRTRKTPRPTTVLLVRHGQTSTTGKVLPGRAPGLHLADAGVAQAERAAARLGALDVAAVYASPLERTRQTAAPIGRATGQRVRTAKGLLECDFGTWTGQSLARLRKLPEWSTVQTAPSRFRFPGGESFAEMQLRIWNEIERLVALHPGDTVVAVSHADPIKALLAHAAGTHLDHLQRLVVSPCSISVVHYGPAAPAVLTINSTGTGLGSLTLS